MWGSPNDFPNDFYNQQHECAARDKFRDRKVSYRLDFFVDFQSFSCNMIGRLFDPPVWGFGETWDRGWHLRWRAYYLTIDTYGLSLTVFELFS